MSLNPYTQANLNVLNELAASAPTYTSKTARGFTLLPAGTSDAQPVPLDAQYNAYVEEKIKDPLQLAREITPAKAHLNHMVMGIAGEAGELVDAIKKHTMYNKELDITNVIEELGDLEFFMAGLRLALDITRGQTIKANTDKLNARYKGKFSNEEAQARADKA